MLNIVLFNIIKGFAELSNTNDRPDNVVKEQSTMSEVCLRLFWGVFPDLIWQSMTQDVICCTDCKACRGKFVDLQYWAIEI